MKESKHHKANQITPSNLSDHELKEKLDLYSKGEEKRFFDIQKIKSKYLNDAAEKQRIRTQADLYYAKGMRTGLPHTSYEKMRSDREIQDQYVRNSVVEEAKSVYRKHQSLTNDFDKEKATPYSPDQLNRLSKYFDKYALKTPKSKTVKKEHSKHPTKGRKM